MKKTARTAAITCLIILVLDFLTLENRVVTTNPNAQKAGHAVGASALLGLATSLGVIFLGRQRSQDTKLTGAGAHKHSANQAGTTPSRVTTVLPPHPTAPPAGAAPGRPNTGRFRTAKIAVGLLVLATWFVGLPIYAYSHLLSKQPDYVPGPFLADAFLSLYAVAMQVIAPTPIALAFWPSLIASVFLLISRRDRPAADGLSALVALGLTVGICYVLLASVDL